MSPMRRRHKAPLCTRRSKLAAHAMASTVAAYLPRSPIWQHRRHLISKRSCTLLRIKQEPTRMRKPTCGAWHRNWTMNPISGLAGYFSRQSAASGGGSNTTLIAQGKQIFVEGVPGRQIRACATCHGAQAQGNGPFPRLAGQHAPYLLRQLLVIQSALRTAPVMHGVIKDLTKPQMEAVVAYLESI